MGNTEGNKVNGNLRNIEIAVPLKYLSSFWRSRKISLINCKVELKLKRTTHCILSALGTDTNDANSSKITFDTKDSKLYVLAVTLLGKHNQNYQNFLAKINVLE